MLQSYLLLSILSLSLCYSLYSFYGVRFFLKSDFSRQETIEKRTRSKPAHVIPVYMWDIYKNGLDSSEVDTVRGIHPKFISSSFTSPLFPNHRSKQMEFRIPTAKQDEILVKAEVRVTTTSRKNRTTHFQIYLKSDRKWIFLQEKKVSGDNVTWISLQVTPTNSIFSPGSAVSFLILTLFPNREEDHSESDFSHPVLLLSYFSGSDRSLNREKRNLGMEDYEEKTNNIWGQQIMSEETTKMSRSSCRRKSLYIEFSDINYDSWIVAPSGYDAFQCVGKCTFPVGQHLSPTKHAILQTLLHNISPWKTSRACCVPTKLDPISILYLDENGVLTYKFRYRDMVVAECGCR